MAIEGWDPYREPDPPASNVPTEDAQTIVKTYKGTRDEAATAFRSDARTMADRGYFPISQSYQPGEWGCGEFIVALLLCFVLIGFLVFIYMLIVKPAGTLIVTYEYRDTQDIENSESPEVKTCPMCAETINAAAKVCRYCRHEFTYQELSE